MFLFFQFLQIDINFNLKSLYDVRQRLFRKKIVAVAHKTFISNLVGEQEYNQPLWIQKNKMDNNHDNQSPPSLKKRIANSFLSSSR